MRQRISIGIALVLIGMSALTTSCAEEKCGDPSRQPLVGTLACAPSGFAPADELSSRDTPIVVESRVDDGPWEPCSILQDDRADPPHLCDASTVKHPIGITYTCENGRSTEIRAHQGNRVAQEATYRAKLDCVMNMGPVLSLHAASADQ